MVKPAPPLGWLRTFECAGRHLSFTLAADELRMTQSAVSQQIRSLESRLGCQLFVRKHRSVALTDEGRRLLPDIAQAINQLHMATNAFVKTDKPALLTIASSVSVAQWFLVPRLKDFIARHPELAVRIITTVWPDEFSHASADVHIRFGAEGNSPYKEQALGTNRMVMVASPDYVKAKKMNRLTATNLKRCSLIQVVGTSDTWPGFAKQFGLDSALPATINVDSHGMAVDFAKTGSGVALTSELIALPLLQSGALKLVHPKSMPAIDGYFVSLRPESSSPTAGLFIDWLHAQINAF